MAFLLTQTDWNTPLHRTHSQQCDYHSDVKYYTLKAVIRKKRPFVNIINVLKSHQHGKKKNEEAVNKLQGNCRTWALKIQSFRNRLINTENRLLYAIDRSGGETDEIGEGDKEVQNSNDKVN